MSNIVNINTNTKTLKMKTIMSIVFTCILLFLLIFIIYKLQTNANELFENTTEQSNTEQTPIERTKLYGSLFLDNLSEQVINMTDPSIKYDSKRIEIFRYNDILL